MSFAAAGLLCAIPLVPDSKNPVALRPGFTGALLSIAGLALVLWSIIEAPVRGWTSPLVIGAGLGGLCCSRSSRRRSGPARIRC